MDFLEYAKFQYFSPQEILNVCFPRGSSITNVNWCSLQRLDIARGYLGEPIYLTCAFRSREWDIARGRSGTSSHCKGMAFDIRCTDKRYRFRLICALIRAGFTRLGIYPEFVHADDDEDKPSIIWITDKQL